MTDEQREEFDRAWAEFKSAIAEETPAKQIISFAEWLIKKICTVCRR